MSRFHASRRNVTLFTRAHAEFRGLTALMAVTALCLIAFACRIVEPGEGQDAHDDDAVMQMVVHDRTAIVPRVDWQSADVAQAPMALTAGDGSGLRLVSVTGTVVIEDPLAFTELHLTFENPENRRREGRFEFGLPPGAALSRLAMQIGSRWMEGEVVERAQARRTFEDYIHFRPRVDPALMEQASANRVSARVFPIQPRERKEIIVSYSQPITGGTDQNYRLPLQGLPKLDALSVNVIVKTVDERESDHKRFPSSTQRVLRVREHDFAPDRDLVIALDGAGDAGALRAADLVAVRVRPEVEGPSDPVDGLTILFDTSASGARGFDREVERLATMLMTLSDTPVRLLAFDQNVAVLHDGRADQALGAPMQALQERRGFGASDLERALKHSAVQGGPRRLLIWSDGIATAGAVESAILASAGEGLLRTRIDAYASSSSADRKTLGMLASSGERSGFVTGPDLSGEEIAASLTRPGFNSIALDVEGAQWSYPRRLDGFAPGDDIVVFASFPGPAPDKVSILFSDDRLPGQVVPTLDGAAPLVQRAVARARIAELQTQMDGAAEDPATSSIRPRIVALALANRLLTRHTALLVLESAAEYRRHGLTNSARADILTVGPTGIDVLHRGTSSGDAIDLRLSSARDVEADHQARAGGILGVMSQQSGHFLASPHGGEFAVGNDDEDIWGGLTGSEIGEAFGTGGLGLFGTGRGGGGTGEGTVGLGNTVVRHEGEEGKMGKPTTRQKSGLYAKKGPEGSLPQMARNFDPAMQANRAGILGPQAQKQAAQTSLIGKGAGGGMGTGYGAAPPSLGTGYGRGAGAGFGGRGKRQPRVRQAKAKVTGALDRDIIRRIVRAHINEVRSCYNRGLQSNPNLAGRVQIDFTIGTTGRVLASAVTNSSVQDGQVGRCMARATRRWKFPKPRGGGDVNVSYPFILSPGGGVSTAPASQPQIARKRRRPQRRPGDPSDPHGAKWTGSAQSGRFAEILGFVARGDQQGAREAAWTWATSEPDNTLALVALGEVLELDENHELAARVYGSLIDLHPHRADMRRTASARLEVLGETARGLAIDSYRKAVAQRPDQINGHRLLAWALVKDKQYAAAFEVLETALSVPVPPRRFRGVKTLLREDRELVAAAWLASLAERDPTVEARIRAAGVRPAGKQSLRLVAHWETDATDVDILVDPLGRGDGRRHADVRSGFGPEAWISRGSQRPAAVSARVRYFNRGVMGYAMGTVSAISHDGVGGLTFHDRPFVLMNSEGSVELGRFSS